MPRRVLAGHGCLGQVFWFLVMGSLTKAHKTRGHVMVTHSKLLPGDTDPGLEEGQRGQVEEKSQGVTLALAAQTLWITLHGCSLWKKGLGYL